MSSLPFVILISSIVLGTHGLLLEAFFNSGTSFDIISLTISNFLFSVVFRTELLVRCWNSDFLTFLSFVILFLGNFLFCSYELSLTLSLLWSISFQLPHVNFQ